MIDGVNEGRGAGGMKTKKLKVGQEKERRKKKSTASQETYENLEILTKRSLWRWRAQCCSQRVGWSADEGGPKSKARMEARKEKLEARSLKLEARSSKLLGKCSRQRAGGITGTRRLVREEETPTPTKQGED